LPPAEPGPFSPSAESAGPCGTGAFVIRAPVSYGFQSLTYLQTQRNSRTGRAAKKIWA
jgi:hypothetical protein